MVITVITIVTMNDNEDNDNEDSDNEDNDNENNDNEDNDKEDNEDEDNDNANEDLSTIWTRPAPSERSRSNTTAPFTVSTWTRALGPSV